MPYQPLQLTIWPSAPGVQVILRKAPIPLLPARHCFLASEALLALCDPESRIQHSSGSRAPRPASPRVSSCLSLRASSLRHTSWRGPSRQKDVCALSYLHQTPGLRSSRIIIFAAAPLDGWSTATHDATPWTEVARVLCFVCKLPLRALRPDVATTRLSIRHHIRFSLPQPASRKVRTTVD